MERDGPVRSCAGCRRRRPVAALVRITDDPATTIDGPSSGRGAWLCRLDRGVDPSCLDRAMRSGGIARAWRRPIGEAEAATLRGRLSTWRAG